MKSPRTVSAQIKKTGSRQKKQPGIESIMRPLPSVCPVYFGSNRLKNKVAIITGGDSGIGHAVALLFASEGANIVISYLSEHKDAEKVRKQTEYYGRRCLLIAGDIGQERNCHKIIKKTLEVFGKIDILINNAAEQHPADNISKISPAQLRKTFTTNVFSYFYMISAALPYLKKGGIIVNTASVTSYKGSDHLLDYSATKGAIVTMTRSLSASLVKKGIRVNAVAPGPVWTPLIEASFSNKKIRNFGCHVPMKRAGQPSEIAPAYLFLACEDSSYMTGQVLHPNGGIIVNG